MVRPPARARRCGGKARIRWIGPTSLVATDALVAAGGEIVNDERGEFTLPPDLVEEGIAAGIIVYCEEHQAPELAEGITPERIEEWIGTRPERTV